jgi:enediyne biosynthesis protein E4
MKSILLVSSFTIIFFLWGLFSSYLFAQTFEKVTDQDNPVVTTVTDQNYSGSAWIDIDGDGNEDLFTTKDFLFRNLGNSNFERVTNFQQLSSNQLGNGASWADYDNDGDIDLFLSGNPSLVYRNDGSGNLEAITESPLGIADDNRGWTGAWADYDNDGFVDLIIAHPDGFLGNPGIPCRFFNNNGDGRFTQLNVFEFTTLLEPYTVATWSDYDLDGDIDLFIGSGPVNHSAPDFLYDNTLMQNGVPNLIRIATDPIATDNQDGQIWNWIDYDNDGDLDAMVTNYGLVPNRLYKNNNGSYQSITNSLTTTSSFLGNSWGDIDNDGDLDVVLTSESSAQVFINDVNDTFTLESTFTGAARSSSLADYDNDGDIDMFVSGTGNVRGLYKNVSSNGNNWVSFKLTGTVSNRSAIGTKVRLKANINGNDVWQFREVSAQNNFNGMNSLRIHFGLGNASVIDSVIIDYPSGQRKILTNLAVNNFYSDAEEIPSGFLRANFKADSINGEGQLTVQFSDLSLTDPSIPITTWEWDFNNDGTIDATDQNPSYTYSQLGDYSVKLIVSTGSATDTLTRANYITINPVTRVEYEKNLSPDKFQLFQNYPNPFNPNTSIKFYVPEESFVSLKVYNVLGTEVAELVNEKKTPGLYELNFGGENLPSGVYVYRAEVGSFTASKKMLLLK